MSGVKDKIVPVDIPVSCIYQCPDPRYSEFTNYFSSIDFDESVKFFINKDEMLVDVAQPLVPICEGNLEIQVPIIVSATRRYSTHTSI